MSIEIEQFRQSVERFDEIIIELERIDDKLSSNFSGYKLLNENAAEITDSQEDIISSISNLQSKSVELIDSINLSKKENKKYQKSTINLNENAIENLKEEFEKFDKQIQKTMSQTINKIDLSQFRKQVEVLFINKIKKLEVQTSKLEDNNKKFKSANQEFEKSFTFTKNHMNVTIDRFNRMNNILNKKVIVMSVLGGMFFGAFIMMLVCQFLK